MKTAFATKSSPLGLGRSGFHALYAKMLTKRYGAHTAYGERIVRKPGSFRNVMQPDGRLPQVYATRQEALRAARMKAEQLFSNHR